MRALLSGSIPKSSSSSGRQWTAAHYVLDSSNAKLSRGYLNWATSRRQLHNSLIDNHNCTELGGKTNFYKMYVQFHLFFYFVKCLIQQFVDFFLKI